MKTAKKSRSRSKQQRDQRRQEENDEIELLNQWIDSQKPDCGSNPLALPTLPSTARIGRLPDSTFSPYVGTTKFIRLPISKKTKAGLAKAGYTSMTKIQRASLPHSICGRDILGAAKTGSGKTLAFVIPVLEKLYREKWSPEDGVGSIIISPTRELAAQLFDVLQNVGKFHGFSAGLFIGGREDVDLEKECANSLNILVCTPGRLLQHMDETPNFDCSQLQVLVLDEADRILDTGFKKALNAILSQLPKNRQTLLFSATQTKSVQDLARLSLKDPEYISVIEESSTPTPKRLHQIAIEVPLDLKMDMLWSFVKTHLNCKTLVFFSSCKQVKFAYKVFKSLHPGVPLKCLHGRMKQEKRMAVYSQFCEGRAVLFSTDVASRGLDFNKAVDWVVQVDCPEDVATYIHRVGRTARYLSGGKSVLFLAPSERKMFESLNESKVPIQFIKPNKSKVLKISPVLSSLLVKDQELHHLAQRAFTTYLRSVFLQKDKQTFNVMKLPIDAFAASLGLPMTPRVRFVSRKLKTNQNPTTVTAGNPEKSAERQPETEPLFKNEENPRPHGERSDVSDPTSVYGCVTRVLKKKKLKINVHRPVGKRVVFDDEGNSLPPLAQNAVSAIIDDVAHLNLEERDDYYRKVRDELKEADKEDKAADRQRRRDKRMREKVKMKGEVEVHEEQEESVQMKPKKIKYETDEEEAAAVSLSEQEALALKLLESMHC